MLKPELKGKPYLQDMTNLADFKPDDSEDFSAIVEFSIGEYGSEKFDNYTINVCTPRWLENDLKKNGKPIFVKGTLLVDRFDSDLIANRIEEIVRSISYKNWADCNLKLMKYFNWEFEEDLTSS